MVRARFIAGAAAVCLAAAIMAAQAPAGPGRGVAPAGTPAARPNPNPPPTPADESLPQGSGRPGSLFGKAHANITGANGLTGTADFYEIAQGTGHMVEVVLSVQNAPPGLHGVHIHAVGKCEGPAYTTAGGHFDPGPAGDTNADTNHPYHMGDLPNISVGASGNGMMNVYTTRVTMGGPVGLFDADGSAIVIHANLDPQVSGPAGSGIAGGARIACGVIER
jgi:Cu-Zn family superoxide dismutase